MQLLNPEVVMTESLTLQYLAVTEHASAIASSTQHQIGQLYKYLRSH